MTSSLRIAARLPRWRTSGVATRYWSTIPAPSLHWGSSTRAKEVSLLQPKTNSKTFSTPCPITISLPCNRISDQPKWRSLRSNINQRLPQPRSSALLRALSRSQAWSRTLKETTKHHRPIRRLWVLLRSTSRRWTHRLCREPRRTVPFRWRLWRISRALPLERLHWPCRWPPAVTSNPRRRSLRNVSRRPLRREIRREVTLPQWSARMLKSPRHRPWGTHIRRTARHQFLQCAPVSPSSMSTRWKSWRSWGRRPTLLELHEQSSATRKTNKLTRKAYHLAKRRRMPIEAMRTYQ